MKAVVTGGAGFIGAATVKCLLEKGHEVWAVVRPDSPRLSNLWHQVPEELRPGLQVISLDVRNLAQEDFRKHCPLADVWLHTSWGGPGSDNRKKRDMQQSNIQDSLAAVRAAAWIGCRRFVFTGSQAEYGICYETMGEDTPCNPVSEYGKAKLEFANQAEKLCKTFQCIWTGRPFMDAGPVLPSDLAGGGRDGIGRVFTMVEFFIY